MLLSVSGMDFAQGGGLEPPPGVVTPFISPTESYIFWIDPLPVFFPSGELNPDYYPATKVLQDLASIDRTGPWSIGNPQGYDHGYELLGFREPDFDGGPRTFYYWDCGDACNGGIAQADQVVMPTEIWRDESESCARNTLGHELMHKIQRAYYTDTAPNNLGTWVIEGHARAMQDKIYAEFDTLPETDCRTIYVEQVKNYLRVVNGDSLWDLSYDAALWWTYLMEQYGEATNEPWYGADFLVTWYDQALLAGEDSNSFDITNSTIQFFDPSQTITSTYRSFVLANIFKDMRLNGFSDDFLRRYTYVDEQAPGEDRYAQVKFADTLLISNASTEDTTTFSASDFGVQNYKVDIADCGGGRPVRISFEPFSEVPVFGTPINQNGAWGVIVGQSSDDSQTLSTQRPAKYFKKIDEHWAVNFFQPFNNPYETVYATTSGIGGSVIGTLRAQCLPFPDNGYTPDVPLVNPLDPVTPGTPLGLTYGEVCAVPSAPLPGLDPDDYTIEVDDVPARVLAATPSDDGHCLLVEFPEQPGPGTYDLTVGLAGQEVTIPGGVVHNNPNPQVLIAIDASSSMLEPVANPKLADVQALVEGFIFERVAGAGSIPPNIGLLEFAGDNIEPNTDARVLAPLLAADEDHLARLSTGLDILNTSFGGFTALGDALLAAESLYAASGDADQSRHLIVIVDGPENDEALWDDIRDQIIASGINVHTIALGPLADQPLLFDIARATGGSYRYVHVDDTRMDVGALSQALSDIANLLAGAVSIAEENVPLTPNGINEFGIDVPRQAIALLLPAVQQAREAARRSQAELAELNLIDPNGVRYDFDLLDNTANVLKINAPRAGTLPAGRWEATLVSSETASDELQLSVAAQLETPLLLSAGIARPEADEPLDPGFQEGDPVQLNATLVDICAASADCDPGRKGSAVARVIAGDGAIRHLSLAQPETAGTEADGESVRRFSYTLFLADGSPVRASDDGMTGGVGSYTLEYEVPLVYDKYTASVFLRDGVAVADSGIRTRDSDSDGLPNPYEARKFCLEDGVQDGALDLDDDGLTSLEEYEAGTDPCNPDTDGGGELDGSELAAGRQPLNRADDAVDGIRYARVAHEVTHDDPQSFASASITIEYATYPRVANIVLKRGRPGGSVEEIANLSPGTGALYVDTNLEVGAEYCYQLDPEDAAGNRGASSRWFCDVARNDPALPWGDLLINRGRPRTDDPTLKLELSIYNKSGSGSEMRIEGDGLDTGWISYEPGFEFQHPGVSAPTMVSVSAQFRDVEGQVSRHYLDSIELWPPQTLGRLTGRALLETVSPTAGVMLNIMDASWEPPAYTDVDGQFRFTDLPPGDYSILASLLGWETTSSTGWMVTAGGETNVGDIVLDVIVDPLFADGFESP